MTSRPAIPKRVKRDVRVRCGFGCVVCGIPLYDYDHIFGYAKVKRHHSDEITLLCPRHHAEKTRGLLHADQVEAANQKPFNRSKASTSPFSLRFAGDSPEIQLANQRFSCNDRRRPTWMIPVLINRHAPLGFTVDTEGLMLNLFATDHRNRCILHIRDSEMVVATSALDVQLIGRRLTILAEESGLALSMSFDPPNKVSIDRYHVNVGGVVVDVDNDKVVFAGTTGQQLTVQGNGSIAANVGIAYGDVPRGLSVAVRAG